jgi:hypothetical protein
MLTYTEIRKRIYGYLPIPNVSIEPYEMKSNYSKLNLNLLSHRRRALLASNLAATSAKVMGACRDCVDRAFAEAWNNKKRRYGHQEHPPAIKRICYEWDEPDEDHIDPKTNDLKPEVLRKERVNCIKCTRRTD